MCCTAAAAAVFAPTHTAVLETILTFINTNDSQVEFPSTLSPAAIETLEKVLPARPVTEFDGEEEESMLEVSLFDTWAVC